MAKTDKKSLRQQMREKAEIKLNSLMEEMRKAAGEVIEDTTIDPEDLMAMCCKTQTGTLRDKLLVRLTDEIQNDLVALWNRQDNLDLGEPDAK